MTDKAIDCLINVHFGEVDSQPTWMLKVRDDYFKGPESMFAPVDLAELLEEMDEQGVRKAILMDNLVNPSTTARKFVEAKPDRFALAHGRGQPAASGAAAARIDRCRVRPAGRLCRCGTELLGRRPIPAQRRRLLSALRQVRGTRTPAVHQYRYPRTADPRRGAASHASGPGVCTVSRTAAVHDPRRRSVVGRRDPVAAQVRQPAVDDVGVVAQAAAGKPAALHANAWPEQGDLRIGLAGVADASSDSRSSCAGPARRGAGQLSLQQRAGILLRTRSTDHGPIRTAQTGLQPVRRPCGPADRVQAILQDALLDRNSPCRRTFRLRQEPVGAAVRDGRHYDGACPSPPAATARRSSISRW